MQDGYDYQRFAVLYVDDELMSLKYFARAFAKKFRVLTASTAQDGLQILEQHRDSIGIVMTDQRMPGKKGVWLLEQARQMEPRIVRILATAYSDMEAAIAAVNSGAIYKYVHKPWDPPQLEATLARGMEFFLLQKERDELIQERVHTFRNVIVADRIVSLGLLAAGLSHHIRNSLVAVKTFLDLAPEQLRHEKTAMAEIKNPEFWNDYYQNVQQQIHKINALLNDLWSVSEQRGSRFEDRVEIQRVIADAIRRSSAALAEKGIRIDNQVPDTLPSVLVDQNRFERLFDLLFRDEIVSLPSGSVVTVHAEPVFRGSHRHQDVLIRISDNGPGLPREALRVLFDPFSPRSDCPAEYGINLMACYFIVHHHGGTITAESEHGRGTAFHIQIPTQPSQSASTDEDDDFTQRILATDAAWKKLLTAT